jgi:hypothetical protein
MTIVFVGIDLAKNVFAVHGVNPAVQLELVRPNVPRARMHEMIAALPPAPSEWKRARERITGQGCSKRWATP